MLRMYVILLYVGSLLLISYFNIIFLLSVHCFVSLLWRNDVRVVGNKAL